MMLAQPNNDTKDTDDGCDNGKRNLHYVNNKGYQRAAYTETTCIIAAEEECKDPNGEMTPLKRNYENRFHNKGGNNPARRSNISAYYYTRSTPMKSTIYNDYEQTMNTRYYRKKPTITYSKNISTISAAAIALMLCISALVVGFSHVIMKSNTNDISEEHNTTYSSPNLFGSTNLFDEMGRFILDNYDTQTPHSDFLPGLAGIYGKPLYAFFVNRGQGIASFGVESKHEPIMEFSPANNAYQTTPLLGFRTFIQGRRAHDESEKSRAFVIEPFSPLTTNFAENTTDQEVTHKSPNKRTLYSGQNEMQIQEIDYEHDIETNVTYFILPEEDFGAFVRRTTITNTHPDENVDISFLDGLARMQPAGGDIDTYLKTMGNTLEGFMGVYFPYDDSTTMPFYRLSASPTDSEFIEIQERGHYCVSMKEDQNASLLPIVYDISKVFGQDTTLLRPLELYKKSIKDIVNEPQYGKAKTSSCFAAVEDATLQPGESITITTYFGAADHILDVPIIVRRIQQEGFALYKLTRTREVVRQITSSVETRTGLKVFDAHVSQMFLDNSLRGGIPIVLGDRNDYNGMLTVDEDQQLKVFHVFSRTHGDLERDYDDFLLPSTFFSQGPGNFRDVATNRRNDVVFNPKIGSFNIRMFLSFIQADGYEPYSVEAIAFTISDKNICDDIAAKAVGPADGHRAQREALSGILNNGPFRPGQLFRLMTEQNIFLIVSMQEFIDMVAVAAESHPFAVYKKGYWADYWTYYLDMIESYLSIFPEDEERVMFNVTLPYFFSPSFVQPRSKKYVETPSFDGNNGRIQQLDATVNDEAKRGYMSQFIEENIDGYKITAHWQHDSSGNVYESSVYTKLFLLATLKFATRDVLGMGIEYEGGRPGWDEANNGLPGILGSGMPELFELKALLNYLVRTGRKYAREFEIPEELYQLFNSINDNLAELKDPDDNFATTEKVPFELFSYWDNVASARETYREQTRITFSGNSIKMKCRKVINALESWGKEIDKGIARALLIGTKGYDDDGHNGIVPTYFAYEVSKWNHTGEYNLHGHPFVTPLNMTVRSFPLFLEGPTRMMKTVSAKTAREMFLDIRKSNLFDKELRMFTISASLTGQPIEMGRSVAFAQGWLENQSVGLHMSYKLYLELLRHELYDDFFESIREGSLLPFRNADSYGRSPLQCSSFIASSVFEDPSVRGRGFMGRLSGSTAEFLSMWILMFIGPEPFFIDDKSSEVRMQLLPTLPRWLFHIHDGFADMDGVIMNDDGTPRISFKLFSSINVHYYNKKNTDILGTPPERYRIGLRDGSIFDFNQTYIPTTMAQKIRRVIFVDFIEAHF